MKDLDVENMTNSELSRQLNERGSKTIKENEFVARIGAKNIADMMGCFPRQNYVAPAFQTLINIEPG